MSVVCMSVRLKSGGANEKNKNSGRYEINSKNLIRPTCFSIKRHS